jgi:predicted nucleotide-binding protein
MADKTKASRSNGHAGQSETDAKRRAPRPFPPFSLEDTVDIAQAIGDHNAGKPYSKLSLAETIGRKPDSSAFRGLLSASMSYGLTEGSYKQALIKLTALGESVAMPQDQTERRQALVKATRNIPLYNSLYEKFDQAKLPPDQNFKNTLIREHGVEAAYAEQAVAFFRADGKFTGLIRHVAGADRVDLQQAPLTLEGSAAEPAEEQVADETPATAPEGSSQQPTRTSSASSAPKAAKFFVAHGVDHYPVEQLQSILNEFKIPYVVAKNEAHAGRPISEKVAELMNECSGGIFIFSADEQVATGDGKTEKRPRLNVVFELGAASLLYGKRIVIFKEEGVVFGTDFSDLGYIPYEKGQLITKSVELLKELIKLGALQLLPGGG